MYFQPIYTNLYIMCVPIHDIPCIIYGPAIVVYYTVYTQAREVH